MSDRPAFLDQAPTDARLTNYDRANAATYLRLLDAESEGAPWEDVAKIIFGIDPKSDPGRAEQMYKTHLARAHWMTDNGFKDLVRGSMN